MSAIFSRRRTSSARSVVCDYVIGLACVLVASLAWHGLRAYVVRALACSSVGCEARAKLITGAIDELYPRQRVYVLGGEPVLRSYRQGNRGGVAWLVDWAAGSGVQPPSIGSQTAVADANLNWRGSLRLQRSPWRSPDLGVDRDGDGAFEVAVSFQPGAFFLYNKYSGSVYWPVVRVGRESNEIVGLVVTRFDVTRAGTLLLPGWYDEFGDGTDDWVFPGAGSPITALLRGTRPSPPQRPGSSLPVAVFKWTEPGGVLRPRVVPDDGSMLVWTPADGRPYRFPADKLVDEVCQELLPVPEGFGATPASQPASSPTSSPGP